MNTARFSFELDSITTSDKLFSSSQDEILEEIGKKMVKCMDVERVNIWMFNDDEECINCIGLYSGKDESFSKGEKLCMIDIPHYYSSLKSNKILLVEDVQTSPITKEIKDIYCKPHGITAMMDLPIRMEGKLVGVMCFEYTKGPREWDDNEVQFALAMNQVVSLALETRRRRNIQIELIKALEEKDLLLREMHHRIKNNLSILISLLRMQARESGNKEIEQNLSEAQNRIFSMVKIHEQLYQTGNYLKVNLALYLEQLIQEFESSVDNLHQVKFIRNFAKIEVDTSTAINLGLIAIEVLNNAIKHAFGEKNTTDEIKINLSKSDNQTQLIISDNGHGYDTSESPTGTSIGMSIVEDLVQQIDGILNIQSSKEGTEIMVAF
jgi:two-component sensor histidine kinase